MVVEQLCTGRKDRLVAITLPFRRPRLQEILHPLSSSILGDIRTFSLTVEHEVDEKVG